jgi:hypothetical protein
VVRIPAKIRDDSVILSVQTSREVHPAPFLIGSRSLIYIDAGGCGSALICLVTGLRISGAILPLPIWFAEGQIKFNVLREIKGTMSRAVNGRRCQQKAFT